MPDACASCCLCISRTSRSPRCCRSATRACWPRQLGQAESTGANRRGAGAHRRAKERALFGHTLLARCKTSRRAMSAARAANASARPARQAPDAAVMDCMALIETFYPLPAASPAMACAGRFDLVERIVPLERHEVPSGTQVFDWRCRASGTSAMPVSPTRGGRRVIDFRAHNLHVVNYSMPVRAHDVARRTAAAPAFAARAAGLDPLPYQLLPRGLGLLPAAPRSRAARSRPATRW